MSSKPSTRVAASTNGTSPEGETESKKEVTCGLIMPISAIDGCTADHWSEVKSIVMNAIEGVEEYSFVVRLVSDADDVGVIQKRIVHNLYASDIVVCDVSGKNPNVMFELGLRLAFDKPTIIIKDDKTDYSFDTGVIEHITYPRDLRFGRIVSFANMLAEKVVATYRNAVADPEHSTFLKNFGKFKTASLSEQVVPVDKMLVEMMQDLHMELARLRRDTRRDLSRRMPLEADGGLAVADALARYRLKHPGCELESLLTDEAFYSELERIVEAPRHFRSPVDFRRVVEEQVVRLIKLEQRERDGTR